MYLRLVFVGTVSLLLSCSNGGEENSAVSRSVESGNATDIVPSIPQTKDGSSGSACNSGTVTVSGSDNSRRNAFDDAFNAGYGFGLLDGRKGVYDSESYAESYTDEWIRQQFISGYELGYSEAVAEMPDGSCEPIDYDYDNDATYYYEDMY